MEINLKQRLIISYDYCDACKFPKTYRVVLQRDEVLPNIIYTMEQKQKTDLFRFVTLRAPQLISTKRRLLGFVEHPNPSGSHFLSAISGYSDITVARTTLAAKAGTFNAYKTVDEIKGVSTDLWNFSLWLVEYKNKLTRSELDALIPTLPVAAEIIKLWDNLFYDILQKKNGAIRQGCLQMIVAINFINKYVSYSPGVSIDEDVIFEEAKLLKRLANGKVIVDRAFTVQKSPISAVPIGLLSRSYVRHEAVHCAFMEGLEIGPLEAIHNEFCNLAKSYRIDSEAAYKTQFDTYKTQTESTISQYMAQNNLTEPITEDDIRYGVVSPFKFNYAAPLSTTYTQGKLSASALAYLSTHCFDQDSVEQVMRRLEADIREKQRFYSGTSQKKFSEILIKGIPTRPSASVHHDYAFTPKVVIGSQQNSVDVYMTINAGYRGSFLKNPSFSISIGVNNYSHSNLDVLDYNSDFIFIKLSFATLSSIPKNTEFVMSGELELSNGKTLTMTRTGIGGLKFYSGSLFTTQASTSVELYGVNRIGVADYRRVEQELCCYVPGEVSHIENIMAKEYKEKSTRKLTRTEIGIESRSEREIEELSDTTSTSRHEMSTEISQVIDKDRNINVGFSAGANGNYGKTVEWNTSANGDFAFGHATSESNSEARTYAEDVTRRALERIVQKTSILRTSKIIQEFEENNKHGFDNRQGENHVTGVYRWIDKVYKNRIVNYGKRLIYEFMLPEPARFYKEAMITQIEEDETILESNGSNNPTVGKPIHPKEHGITKATDITVGNYLEKLALYGAEEIAPMDNQIDIADSFVAEIGSDDKPHAYSFTESAIVVPEFYYCGRIVGKAQGNFKANRGDTAYFKFTAGGVNWEKAGWRGEADFDHPVDMTHLNLTSSITVKVNTRKITAFNLGLTAKCFLKESVIRQWQQDVYNGIMKAYEQQLQAYNDSLALSEANETTQQQEEEDAKQSNSGFNADIMATELKRLCIEMITQPFGIDQGKDFYVNGACDIPSLHLTRELDSYSSHVKFFEQAFDWNLMSSIFYPYYWAKKCDWKALFHANDGNDHVFRAFLKSGMGRVVVPVREGFEDAVTYFMETGEIWNGIGLAVATDDELYLSIMDETTYVEGDVEGQEWETVVPSTLTLVQARSALLDQEGLPCCENDVEVLAELSIKADTNILIREGETPTT